jgi:hypothetical protein
MSDLDLNQKEFWLRIEGLGAHSAIFARRKNNRWSKASQAFGRGDLSVLMSGCPIAAVGATTMVSPASEVLNGEIQDANSSALKRKENQALLQIDPLAMMVQVHHASSYLMAAHIHDHELNSRDVRFGAEADV